MAVYETLDEAIGVAVGAASMCWEFPEKAGVFDSTRAVGIVTEISQWIKQHYTPTGPNLGLASTRDLLAELVARSEVAGYADYRTVDDI